MFTLEGTLNSIWDFFYKLLITFYHSFFRSRLFFKNILKDPEVYISAKTYLFISIFTNYFIYKAIQASGDEFLGLLDFKYYQKTFSDVLNFSVLDIIMASAPYAVIAYCIILLLVKCLRTPAFWKKFFTDSAVYLFASARFLFCLIFLAFITTSTISLNLFGDHSDIDGGIFFYVFLGAGLIILLLPVIRLKKTIYLKHRTLVKFFVLQIFILGSVFLTIYPFLWEEDVVASVAGKTESNNPIRAFSSRMEKDNVIIWYQTNKDSTYTLSCTLVVENKSKKTCYLLTDETLSLSFYDNHTLALKNDDKKEVPQGRVLLLKPDDYLTASYSTRLDTACTYFIKSLMDKQADSIISGIYFPLETIDPNIVEGLFSSYNKDVSDLCKSFTKAQFLPKQ